MSEMVQVLSDRCQNVNKMEERCNRQLRLNEKGETFCFYCKMIEEQDYAIQKQAQEGLKRMKLNKMAENFELYSTIPPKLKRSTFENYSPNHPSQETGLRDCRSFAENFTKNLQKENDIGILMHGSYGNGKSHLAISIAKRVLELSVDFKNPNGSEGVSVIFIHVAELIAKIKDTWRKDSKVSEAEIMEMLKTCDLLIIDELGGKLNKKDEDGQSWLNDVLLQITDGRQGRNTIYTTNLTPSDLSKYLNAKIYERIFYNLHVLEFKGESHRMRGQI